MPKKKIPDKEKFKQATGKDDEFRFKRNESENTDDEYITVADSEINQKYSKRLIQNNWSKYEEKLLDFESEDEGNDVPKTDDFNHLLETASSDCSHFQFNSEKLWKSEESSLPPSSIFNLDLNILSSGLACVPFYERIGLDESYLSAEDKQRLDSDAERNLKDYTLLREKLSKKVENESIVKSCENVRTLDESFRDKLDLNVNSDKDKKIDGSENQELGKTDLNKENVDMFLKNESGDKKGERRPKTIFSENNEDLEDWLDSVLDD